MSESESLRAERDELLERLTRLLEEGKALIQETNARTDEANEATEWAHSVLMATAFVHGQVRDWSERNVQCAHCGEEPIARGAAMSEHLAVCREHPIAKAETQATERAAQIAGKVIDWHRARAETDLRGVRRGVVNAIRSGVWNPDDD